MQINVDILKFLLIKFLFIIFLKYNCYEVNLIMNKLKIFKNPFIRWNGKNTNVQNVS